MRNRDVSDRWTTACGCAIAAFAVGQAVHSANGNFRALAMLWLTLAGIAALAAVAGPAIGVLERLGSRAVVTLVAVGLAWQFYQLFTTAPGIYVQTERAGGIGHFRWGLSAAAVLCGVAVAGPLTLARRSFFLVLAVFAYLGYWMLVASPDPFIDTYVFQRDAAAALAGGSNPYALRYPDIYGTSPFYGEGLSVGGVLQFGYPYPPLSLVLTLPVQLLLGDYRYAQLVAMLLSAACIAYATPGRVGVVAAASLLFTPRTFFVLEQGWTDPLVLLGFAAVVLAALKRTASLPWVFGLALALKQYTVFMVPAAWLLVPPARTRAAPFLLKAIGLAAVVTLPSFLWGPRDFWHSVVMLQFLQPFRNDSLSYLAWASRHGIVLPAFVGFVAAAAALALGLWRQPRTPAGFAATCALTYLAFFAFNKQAFGNYYYFTLGALLVSVAAVDGVITSCVSHTPRKAG
jgi:hypothetical protein